MSELSSIACEACSKGASPASEDNSQRWMAELVDWSIDLEDGVPHLSRSYTFSNYAEALAFTNAVGEIAEAENHHPKITLEWGKVRVEWWTHVLDGLHKNDFIMAARCDKLRG